MTDWLMVIITGIYVVATIVISKANITSAKAAQNQVLESRRQFEESQRLQIMPFLQISFRRANRVLTIPDLNLLISSGEMKTGEMLYVSELEMSIENVGLGPAKDIAYQWYDTKNKFDRGRFPVQALCSRDDCAVQIDFSLPESECMKYSEERLEPKIILHFKDLLENNYSQELNLGFHIRDKESFFNDSPLCFDGYDVEPAVFLSSIESKSKD